MNLASKIINGLLSPADVRLIRASSFWKLAEQLERTQSELKKLKNARAAIETDQEKLLRVSQSRWRADEPDAGLTWGVHMVGDEFVQFLVKQFAFSDRTTIVEIGPGYGRILESLLKQSVPFRRYIGLEISAARVARLIERFHDKRIEFREADVLTHVDLNAMADLTVSSAVFEHLYPDFGTAIKTVAQFTRPGGMILFDLIRDDDNPDKSAAWFEE